jgi:hypothetical protein
MGGSGYGPTKGFRLIAATLDPTTLKTNSAWYLATTLPLEEAIIAGDFYQNIAGFQSSHGRGDHDAIVRNRRNRESIV